MRQIAFFKLMIAGSVPEGETPLEQATEAASDKFAENLELLIRDAFGDGMDEGDLVSVGFESYVLLIDEDEDEHAKQRRIDAEIDALVALANVR